MGHGLESWGSDDEQGFVRLNIGRCKTENNLSTRSHFKWVAQRKCGTCHHSKRNCETD